MRTRDPEVATPPGGILVAVIRFARALRDAGLRADLGAVIAFARALTVVDIGRREEVRAAGAACFVERPEERIAYDDVFDRFWLGRGTIVPEPSHGGADSTEARRPVGQSDAATDSFMAGGPTAEVDAAERHENKDGGDARAPVARMVAYSAAEALRAKSFDRMTPEELSDAARLIDHLRPRLARRRTRRYRLHRRGSLPAPRAMLRHSLGTGGDQVLWLWRRRSTRPRPIVAICDISGSMERYSRFALRFAHALTRLDVRTESFVFGTRLTRITAQLRRRDPDEALSEASAAVYDWAGGTQIGKALHEFNRSWANRVLRSSAVVIVVSDGWDRGDPRIVSEEMDLLRRRCHRLVWLNPLALTAGYEPRTAGMAAAYPFIDEFLGLNSVESLDHLARLLRTI